MNFLIYFSTFWGYRFFWTVLFQLLKLRKSRGENWGKTRFAFWWVDAMSSFILGIQKFLFWFTVPSLLRLRPIEASFCPKNDVPCTKGIKRMASICALPSWQINLKSLLCLQNLFSSRLCQTTKS